MAVQIYVYSMIAVALVVFVVIYLVADKLIHRKAARDEQQFKASKAASVAEQTGFQVFDDLLRWWSVGNIKQTWKILDGFFNTYCLDPRGPVKLAYDIFVATWSKLRVDPEYGQKVRERVVSDALGVAINDSTDVSAVRAADRAERIGWTKIQKIGLAWADRKWDAVGAAVRSLFDEFMEPDGEVKISMRVARPTLAILWDSKVEGARQLAESIVAEKAAELGWTPPAAVAGAQAAVQVAAPKAA